MITKFKIFENVNDPKYKIGDIVLNNFNHYIIKQIKLYKTDI